MSGWLANAWSGCSAQTYKLRIWKAECICIIAEDDSVPEMEDYKLAEETWDAAVLEELRAAAAQGAVGRPGAEEQKGAELRTVHPALPTINAFAASATLSTFLPASTPTLLCTTTTDDHDFYVHRFVLHYHPPTSERISTHCHVQHICRPLRRRRRSVATIRTSLTACTCHNCRLHWQRAEWLRQRNFVSSSATFTLLLFTPTLPTFQRQTLTSKPHPYQCSSAFRPFCDASGMAAPSPPPPPRCGPCGSSSCASTSRAIRTVQRSVTPF